MHSCQSKLGGNVELCVFSNSHAASLRYGWEKMQEIYPEISVTFFAAPNKGLAKVHPTKDGTRFESSCPVVADMLHQTSGGAYEVQLDRFDAYFVHGLFLSAPRLDLRLSEAVKKLCIEETVVNSLNYRFVKDLFGLTNKPIFYSANPLLADLEDSNPAAGPELHTYAEVSSWIDQYYQQIDARCVLQPEETVKHQMGTKKEYSVGSKRLNLQSDVEPHKESDVRHMNGKYGELILQKIILMLNESRYDLELAA